MITIYHNPRCGKSRAALKVLQDLGLDIQIVEYLKTPLDRRQLTELLAHLNMHPFKLIRKGERIFIAHFKQLDKDAVDWIQAMIDYPILIELPIIKKGNKAVIGRDADWIKII